MSHVVGHLIRVRHQGMELDNPELLLWAAMCVLGIEEGGYPLLLFAPRRTAFGGPLVPARSGFS